MRPVGAIRETGISFSFEPIDPFANNGGKGLIKSSRWFDTDLKSFLRHLVTPLLFVFALSHNVVISVRINGIIPIIYRKLVLTNLRYILN